MGALQDALSKTIPIWAALLNRAVARLHTQRVVDHIDRDSRVSIGHSSSSGGGSGVSEPIGSGHSPTACSRVQSAQAICSGCGDEEWDTSLYLPPWLPRSEVDQVEDRMDAWLDSLLEV